MVGNTMMAAHAQTQDRIEREAVYPVSRERLFAALTTPEDLKGWFTDRGTEIDLRIGGAITFHFSDATYRAVIAGLDPPAYFAWRWVPGSDEDPDRPLEEQGPLTLVEFWLEDVADGTRLRVVESGFAALSPERNARNLAENTEGWDECMVLIGQWLETHGGEA